MSMRALTTDVAVIGGGAAGLAAALGALEGGARVALIERDRALGGILLQCIHNGFGLHRFGAELTGPEYAARDIAALAPYEKSGQLQVFLGTSVLRVDGASDSSSTSPARGPHVLELIGAKVGSVELGATSVVFACGCRERTRAQIGIPGTRPAGVLTAGAAQRLCNIDGALVGKRVVILGSGDIGLIMARRMTWEGAQVLCVCELMAEPGGLRRNIVQCLDDNHIPLYLSCTVTNIIGYPHLTAVELCDVDPTTRNPLTDTARVVPCDALLLSVGLIPDNSLVEGTGAHLDVQSGGPKVTQNYETSVPGCFVAGNELHVHDLADFVSEEGLAAGTAAARFALMHESSADKNLATHTSSSDAGVAQTPCSDTPAITLVAGRGASVPTPYKIEGATQTVPVRFRPKARIEHAVLIARMGDRVVKQSKKQVVVPSEMQTLKLQPKDLAGLCGELTIECVPQAQLQRG